MADAVTILYGPDELVYGPSSLLFGGEAPTIELPPATVAPSYSVDLCTSFVKVGEAEAYTFDGIARNLATGQWKLTAPLSGVSAPDVDAVDSLIVWDDEFPPKIVFAGIVRRVGGVQGARVRVLTATDDVVEWVGVDIYGLLAQRQVWPTPSTVPPWADAYDVRTGRGSTVAAQFINANAGATALTDRRITGLVVTDGVVGTESTWSGRLQPLDQMVGRICRESGITCSARMPERDVFEFILRPTSDHSTRLILSDQGDLENMSKLVTPGEATHVIGAGQGDLTARMFAAASTGAIGLARVETVYENTNIETAPSLLKATETELALAAGDVSVDGTITETAAQQIRYIDDYELGDWLGVEVAGVRYQAQVEAVTFTFDKDRQIVRPVLGRAATSRLLDLIRDVANLQSRLDRQIA